MNDIQRKILQAFGVDPDALTKDDLFVMEQMKKEREKRLALLDKDKMEFAKRLSEATGANITIE